MKHHPQRVAELARRVGGVPRLAALSNLSERSIQRFLEDGSKPSKASLRAMARATNVPVEWLEGEDVTAPTVADATEGPDPRDLASNEAADVRYIPVLSVSVSAGPGAFPGAPASNTVYPLPAEFLRRLGAAPGSAAIITVSGDSMMPTLMPGDLVLVDTYVEQLAEGALYIFSSPYGSRIKRLAPTADGRLELRSDNPSYPTEIIPADRLEDLKINARLVTRLAPL